MKKPIEPRQPKHPTIPSKTLSYQDSYTLIDGGTLAGVLEVTEGIDPNKIKFKSEEYYGDFIAHYYWDCELPNPKYEKQMKKYEAEMIVYQKEMAAYKKALSEYKTQMKEYLRWYHESELRKLE